MVLNAESLYYLNRKVDLVTARGSSHKRLQRCFNSDSRLRKLYWNVQVFIFGWCLRRPNLRSFQQVVGRILIGLSIEHVEVYVAAVCTHQDDSLSLLVQLHAACLISGSKRLRNRVDSVHASAWADWVVVHFNSLALVTLRKVSEHKPVFKMPINRRWDRGKITLHDVV